MARTTLGIIGGMGPAATIDFYHRVLSATRVSSEQEHLHVIIDSDPSVPDRTAFLLNQGPDPRPQLIRIARRLEAAGAALLVMPCNTAHVWHGDINDSVDIPLVNWVGEVTEFVASAGAFRQVGLLATTGTLISDLYQAQFAQRGMTTVLPDDPVQRELMDVIYGRDGIKRTGAMTPGLGRRLSKVGLRLEGTRIDAMLIGCTELSVLLARHPAEWRVPVFDGAQVVAERVVAIAGGSVRSTAHAFSTASH